METLVTPSADPDMHSDDSRPVKKTEFSPGSTSKTSTTLVGQVRGEPAPIPNKESATPRKIKPKNQNKTSNFDSGHDSPSSSPSPIVPQSQKIRSSMSSTHSSDTKSSSTVSSMRPKSQYLAELPPRPPKKQRHSYHQPSLDENGHSDLSNPEPSNHNRGNRAQHPSSTQGISSGNVSRKTDDNITYADLDPKAFMVPANHVLPSPSKHKYAEVTVSRSRIV